jgi:hypothetical protein
MLTEARVTTEHGAAYVKKLCRHFAHKVPTQQADNKARIEFPFGHCRIETGDKHVHFSMVVDNPDAIDKAEQVVAEHFIRMANRDKPEVVWLRSH